LSFQQLPAPRITRDVPIKLLGPEFRVTLRGRGNLAPVMPVPETPVDEDYSSVTREYDVRLPWQISAVKPVPQTEGVQRMTQRNLGRGVRGANSGHSL
jgi:hypothetical protein